jgi:hypothetical protein
MINLKYDHYGVGQLTMSHHDVIVMCKPNLHDVFVTWHFSVVSDIIFR